MADHDQTSGRRQGNAGRKVVAIVFIVGVTALIVALDRFGVFGPGHEGGEGGDDAGRLERSVEGLPLPGPGDTETPASGADSEVSAPISVTGNYSGSEIHTAGYSEGMSFALEVSLDQRGGAVYGNYSNSAGDAGNLKGSVDGDAFSGRIESLMLPGNFCDFQSEVKQGGVVIQGSFDCTTGDRSRFTLKRR